jgi:hypothetical protein
VSVLHYPANKGAQAAVAGRDGVTSMMKRVSLGKVKRLNVKSRELAVFVSFCRNSHGFRGFRSQ